MKFNFCALNDSVKGLRELYQVKGWKVTDFIVVGIDKISVIFSRNNGLT